MENLRNRCFFEKQIFLKDDHGELCLDENKDDVFGEAFENSSKT